MHKDVVIIGSGIAGLTCAIYLKRANIDFVVIEKNDVGGLLNKLKRVDNYPGFSSCSGKDILLSLRKQIDELGIEVIKNNVVTILMDKNGFKIVLEDGSIIAKEVVIATGIARNKNELIDGEKEYFGRGVSYCAVCDGAFFKGSDVAVIGNKKTAIEEALYLANIVNKIYFIHDDDINKNDLEDLRKFSNIEIIKDKVKKINGDTLGVNSLTLESGRNIDVLGVFPYTGEKGVEDFLRNINLNMNNGFIDVDENMETMIKGVFAIGDVRVSKLKQLVTAASDGAISSLQIIKNLKTK